MKSNVLCVVFAMLLLSACSETQIEHAKDFTVPILAAQIGAAAAIVAAFIGVVSALLFGLFKHYRGVIKLRRILKAEIALNLKELKENNLTEPTNYAWQATRGAASYLLNTKQYISAAQYYGRHNKYYNEGYSGDPRETRDWLIQDAETALKVL